jgi:5-amino-6-(5-phosphoribosylamino)uracil reductase
MEPLLLHPAGADTSGVPAGVELRGLGSGGVDLEAAMRSLYADGVRVVLCEGGPTLLGQLHELDLIDELFLSLAPILASGTHVGILGGGTEIVRQLSLHRVWEANGFLFLNYRRVLQEQPASPEQPAS